MRRVLGYLFLLSLVAAGLLSLKDRFNRGSTFNPFGEKPDWVGIVCIASTLLGAVWILTSREKRGTTHGGKSGNDRERTSPPGPGA